MDEALRKALRHRPDCPAPETLIGVLEQSMEGDRIALDEHVRRCPACQTELTLFRGFEAGEPEKEEVRAVNFIVSRLKNTPMSSGTGKRPRERFWLFKPLLNPVWMGGASLALAAILIAFGLTSQGRLRHGTVSSEADDRIVRSLTVKVASPKGELTESPRSVEWQPVPGASEYSVNLSEIDGTVIFHKTITSSPLLLPEGTRTLLQPGKAVLVDVAALDRTGREFARSGGVKFHVAANSSGSQ